MNNYKQLKNSTRSSSGAIKRLIQQQNGFTLVELLVVILIIGILLAIALPTFLNQQNKAHDTQAKTELNTAYKSAKSSAASNTADPGHFPGADQLIADLTSGEPELTVVQTPLATAADIASHGSGDLGVVSSSGGTDLCTVETSQSGTTLVLTVSGLGAQQTSSFADAANANCSGMGDTGGTGGTGDSGGTGDTGGSGSSGNLVMVASRWDDNLSQAFYKTLSGSSSDIDTTALSETSDNTIKQFYAGGSIYAISTGDGSGDYGSFVKVDPATSTAQTVASASSVCGGSGINLGTNNVALTGSGQVALICSSQNKIDVMDLSGSNETTILSGFGGEITSVAANSTTVAFTAGGAIWTVPIGGGTPQQVIDPGGQFGGLAMNENGKIAYLYATDGGSPDELYTVPSSGGSPQQLTTNPSYIIGTVSFSPDGTQLGITVLDFNNGGGDGYVINADGTDETQVSDEATDGPGYQVDYVFFTS